MGIQSDTRERLLEMAIELIWQSNYASVGIAEICEQAGTTKGAFYHHFDSKATLFSEAARHHWEQTKRELDAIFSPERGALEQLDGLVGFIVAKALRLRCDAEPVANCPFFTSGAQCGTDETKVREAAVDLSDKAVRYSSVLVRNLLGEGLLASDCDPDEVGRMIHQFTQGLLLYARVHRDPQVLEHGLRDGLERLLDLRPEHRRAQRAARGEPAPGAGRVPALPAAPAPERSVPRRPARSRGA